MTSECIEILFRERSAYSSAVRSQVMYNDRWLLHVYATGGHHSEWRSQYEGNETICSVPGLVKNTSSNSTNTAMADRSAPSTISYCPAISL